MFNVVEAMQNLRLSLTGRPDTDSSGLKKEVLLGSPARPPRGPYNSPWTDPTPQSTQTIQNSLDDLDLKPESASCSVSQTHISDLPGEVLSEVFIHVDVLDLLSIALVCRDFYEASNISTVWQNFARSLQWRSRILVLDDLIHPDTLDVGKLKLAVLKTVLLEDNWSRDVPKVLSTKSSAFQGVSVGQLQFLSSFYIADGILVLPTNSGGIVCINLDNCELIGHYDLSLPHDMIVIRSHQPSRSLYATVGEFSRNNIILRVLQMILPPNTSGQVHYTTVSTFLFPRSWTFLTQIPDTAKRRIFILFTVPEEDTIKVFVILDWDTRRSLVFETNIIYHSSNFHSSIDVRWFSDNDLDHLLVYTEESGTWTQQTYCLRSLVEDHEADLQAAIRSKPMLVRPIRNTIFGFTRNGESIYRNLDAGIIYQYSNLSQWWPRTRGVPYLFSHIHVLVAEDGGELKWSVAQYYSDEQKPYRSERFYVPFTKPVLLEYGDLGIPILGMSFNHLTWIEQDEQLVNGKRMFKRVMRFTSFPHPSKGIADLDASRPHTRTLDIPSNVLDVAYHIFVEPALGSIYIATISNELHRFRYA